jgi:hypothetical protein
MRDNDRYHAFRVTDEAGREMAIAVLRATYHREKQWVADAEQQIPVDDIGRDNISWFVVTRRGRPAGVVRVLYDPPLAQYAKYGLKGVDPELNVTAFLQENRVAEIGRFAVTRRYRRSIMVAAALMRAAAEDTIARGYTHYVTDVFEDDPHSPYGFHTRVMGFLPVATHDTGELRCESRRITLLLDLRTAYKRLKARGNWFYRYLTGTWDEALHRMVA